MSDDILNPAAPPDNGATLTIKQTVIPSQPGAEHIPPREEQKAKVSEQHAAAQAPAPVDPKPLVGGEPFDPLAAMKKMAADVASIKETTDWMRKRFG